MPTVALDMDFVMIAKACGYKNAVCVENFEDLDKALMEAKKSEVRLNTLNNEKLF